MTIDRNHALISEHLYRPQMFIVLSQAYWKLKYAYQD